MSRRFLCFCILMCSCLAARAEHFVSDTLVARYSMYSRYLAPEKLYLHLDRTAYCPGETIWFCGHLTNASPLTVYRESNFIYVEMLDRDGLVEKRVKVRRDGESFPGFINLADDAEPGTYTIRAYTLAQTDLPAEYLFNQRIFITGGRSGGKVRDDGRIDVSFYPEGGRYFSGQPARIGFKAMDSSGKSVGITGKLVKKNGEVVANVASRLDGMGSFRFLPQDGMDYYLELSSGERFPLPGASANGASLSIQGMSGRWMISVTGIFEGSCSVLLRDIAQLRHLADLETGAGTKYFFVPDEAVREGINHLLLVDGGGRILSERLFFKYDDATPVPTVSFPEAKPVVRSRVTMNLDLPDNADADCSVSVLRSSLAGCVQDDGAESYILLSSELKGKINDPRHYFDPSVPIKERKTDIDLLMMIQGWNYYDIPAIFNPKAPLGGESKRHEREYAQQIRGRVKRSLSSKVPENFLLTFLIPALGRTSITPVEAGSNFIIDSLDFPAGTGMLIKINRMGRGMDFVPSWDGEEFAREFKYAPAPGGAYSRENPPVVEYSNPADTLEAAVITAETSSILGITGREMPKSDLKTLGHMNLVNYVTSKAPFSYDGELMHSRRAGLLSTGGEDNWDESPVMLVVNGSVAAWEAFADISISELKSITISTQPDVIYRAKEGVVAIQLDDGKKVTQVGENDISLVFFTPLGYQEPQQFYSPRYDRGEYTGDPDKRNTIFWDPSVKIRNGHAEIMFCTSDETSWPFLVQVEGITSDGKPFSCSASCLQDTLEH